MFLIYVPVIVFVLVIVYAAILYREQRDKEARKAAGLPSKKYHDINDYDVYTVYTVHHK